jgi:uncharacterized protein YcbX
MHVAELWRYPVKSLAGERLDEAELKSDGITGDRLFQVRRSDGRIVDARAHPRLLALHPQLSSAGELLFAEPRFSTLTGSATFANRRADSALRQRVCLHPAAQRRAFRL